MNHDLEDLDPLDKGALMSKPHVSCKTHLNTHLLKLWERIDPDSDEPIMDQLFCAIEDEMEEKDKEYTKFMDDFCEEFMSLVNGDNE